ncbi:MAG: PEP-CTERM sorting domain-containing protein [Armatimonadetes bacterium]|nr:PEP-CTERM sorting domain-containing protein [Armatimonadota bacterium]
MYDLSGRLTDVTILATGGIGSGGGWRFEGNTGGYMLLLNDAANVGEPITYTFSGLPTGPYTVYTYAVKPIGEWVPAEVFVAGSTSQNPQVVTGPMPGNRFEHLITHSIHEVSVGDGTLAVTVSGPWPDTFVNGIQIVPVPEPGTLTVLAVGASVLLLVRRRRR